MYDGNSGWYECLASMSVGGARVVPLPQERWRRAREGHAFMTPGACGNRWVTDTYSCNGDDCGSGGYGVTHSISQTEGTTQLVEHDANGMAITGDIKSSEVHFQTSTLLLWIRDHLAGSAFQFKMKCSRMIAPLWPAFLDLLLLTVFGSV